MYRRHCRWHFRPHYHWELILPSGPAPVAAVGLVTFELNGNVTGSQDRSVGGAFAHETITGTFTVNRDCTSSDPKRL